MKIKELGLRIENRAQRKLRENKKSNTNKRVCHRRVSIRKKN